MLSTIIKSRHDEQFIFTGIGVMHISLKIDSSHDANLSSLVAPEVVVCRGPNASNPVRGRTLPGQERPSNGRPDASQRRPGSMLCPVGLPGALSVDILALLLYWPTYAPITVRLTSDTHVAYWQWRPEQISVKLEGQIGIWHFQWRKSVFACEILLSYSEEQLLCTILCTVLAYFNLLFLLKKIHK